MIFATHVLRYRWIGSLDYNIIHVYSHRRSFFGLRFYLLIGYERALLRAPVCNMLFMFYCVNDETIIIGEHLALLLEPRKRIALR